MVLPGVDVVYRVEDAVVAVEGGVGDVEKVIYLHDHVPIWE